MRQVGEEDGHERQVGKSDHQGPDGAEEVKVDGVGRVPPVAELDVDCCLSVSTDRQNIYKGRQTISRKTEDDDCKDGLHDAHG